MNDSVKKVIIIFILKTLIVSIITLVLLIIMKTNAKFKTMYYKYVYDTNITYSKFNNLYNKYFKDFKIKDIINKDATVSKEKLNYKKLTKYKDNTNYKLYDYVKKGDILGTSNKYLYLLFKKDGKVLDYEKYL